MFTLLLWFHPTYPGNLDASAERSDEIILVLRIQRWSHSRCLPEPLCGEPFFESKGRDPDDLEHSSFGIELEPSRIAACVWRRRIQISQAKIILDIWWALSGRNFSFNLLFIVILSIEEVNVNYSLINPLAGTPRNNWDIKNSFKGVKVEVYLRHFHWWTFFDLMQNMSAIWCQWSVPHGLTARLTGNHISPAQATLPGLRETM